MSVNTWHGHARIFFEAGGGGSYQYRMIETTLIRLRLWFSRSRKGDRGCGASGGTDLPLSSSTACPVFRRNDFVADFDRFAALLAILEKWMENEKQGSLANRSSRSAGHQLAGQSVCPSASQSVSRQVGWSPFTGFPSLKSTIMETTEEISASRSVQLFAKSQQFIRLVSIRTPSPSDKRFQTPPFLPWSNDHESSRVEPSRRVFSVFQASSSFANLRTFVGPWRLTVRGRAIVTD